MRRWSDSRGPTRTHSSATAASATSSDVSTFPRCSRSMQNRFHHSPRFCLHSGRPSKIWHSSVASSYLLALSRRPTPWWAIFTCTQLAVKHCRKVSPRPVSLGSSGLASSAASPPARRHALSPKMNPSLAHDWQTMRQAWDTSFRSRATCSSTSSLAADWYACSSPLSRKMPVDTLTGYSGKWQSPLSLRMNRSNPRASLKKYRN
mmetsp:Transcript_6182/g.12971  ORF Transcript_6182/g.12971 Transcript_6182/m.12971 type:complete len:205 (+) Transcript_6182:2548-3162(+)